MLHFCSYKGFKKCGRRLCVKLDNIQPQPYPALTYKTLQLSTKNQLSTDVILFGKTVVMSGATDDEHISLEPGTYILKSCFSYL